MVHIDLCQCGMYRDCYWNYHPSKIPNSESEDRSDYNIDSQMEALMRHSFCGWSMVVFTLLSGNPIWACDPGIFKSSPTDPAKTFIRKGNGEWNAPRGDGKTHGGVDIITNMSHPEKTSYEVRSVAQGIVAYSRLNGTKLDEGYGNLIVIDHQNGCYSLYAHLASDPFIPMKPGGNLLRKRGDKVGPGELIGYFVDIKPMWILRVMQAGPHQKPGIKFTLS